MGNNPAGANPMDQKYTITISSLSGGIRGVTDTRLSQSTDCENDDPFVDARLFDADITFDSGTNWHVSLSPSGIGISEHDFYSVISHEIGHMLLLRHSCDIPLNGTSDNRIMYFQLNSSDVKRSIDMQSLDGVEIQKTRTIAANSDCQLGFDLNTSTSGCTTATHNHLTTIAISTQNPAEANQPIKLEADLNFQQIDIYNSQNGIKMHSKTFPLTSSVSLDSGLSSGSYLIVLDSKYLYKLIVI